MNKAIKAQWIEALNSGDYSQGESALYYKESGVNQYCCLGVLCDLYLGAHPETSSWRKPDNSSLHFFDVKTEEGIIEELGCNAYPPQAVLEWADLDDRYTNSLAIMNDEGDQTFHQIAEKIDKEH